MDNIHVIESKTFINFRIKDLDNEVNNWLLNQFNNRQNTGFEFIDIKPYVDGNIHARCIVYKVFNKDELLRRMAKEYFDETNSNKST